jgi:TPR repeat protein
MKNILTAVLIVLSCTSWAGELEDGYAAFSKRDYTKALVHYKNAAAQSNALAMLEIGGLYHEGLGVPQDYVQAVHWYKLAAEKGIVNAQISLGYMYKLGEGVGQNFVYAHVWYNLASAQGNHEAAEARQDVAKKMTSQQIAEAQKIARECLARNYKNCD